MHAEEHGTGDRALVLIHGLAGAGSSWRRVAERLSDRYRVLVPDLLGFGRSPWPDIAYSLDDHLAAIERLIEARGLAEARLGIGGHSMGAVLAAELAARRPARTAALVLVSLPYFRSAEEVRQKAADMGTLARLTVTGHWAAGAVCAAMCALRPVLSFVAPHVAPHLPAQVARDALRHNFASYSRSLRNLIVDHRLDATLAALADEPVRLIHGGRDRSAPLDNIRALVERSPAWRLEVVPTAGHDLPIAEPGLVARSIANAASAADYWTGDIAAGR